MLRRSQLFVWLLLVLYAGVARAQVTAVISGTVKDGTGGILPGVSVTATNTETGLTRTVVTSAQGRYVVSNLPSGVYQVRADLEGFQAVVRRDLQLAVGAAVTLDLQLGVGEISEEVVVTGEAPLLNLSNSETAGLVNSREIRDLPINGRDFTELAGLQAGVVLMRNANDRDTSKGYGAKMAFAGARPYQTQVLIDGGDVNTMLNFRTPASAANVQLGVESVKEFQVLVSNYGADVGGFGGGVINAITQSGTNNLHGSGYWFHRNDALDAKNFFDTGQQPPFTRHQYGGSVGGPILTNKLFFFGNYENLRERLGTSRIATVPSESMRQGILSGRSIAISPEIVPYLSVWPLANGRDFGDGTAEYTWEYKEPTDQNYVLGRVDYAVSGSDRLTGRYTWTGATRTQARALPTFVDLRDTASHYALVEYQRIFSSNLLNTFRFHLNRSEFEIGIAELTGVPQALYQFPDRPFSTFSVPGISDIGPDNGAPRITDSTLFEFADDVTFTTGDHTLKIGFLAKRYQLYLNSPFRLGGDYNFATRDAFLQGRPRVVAFQGLDSDAIRNLRQSLFGLYAQDDLRLTEHLTLNLGVRWEFTTVPTEVDGKLTNQIDPQNDREFHVGDPYYENGSLANIAPRVGFAWDPFGKGRTAVRGGVGWYFDPWTMNYYTTSFVRNPPFFERVELRNPPTMIIEDALRVISPADLTLAPSTATYRPGSPNNIHYNLTFQQSLSNTVSVTLAYVGSRGRDLSYTFWPNSAYPSAIIDGRQFFAAGLSRPNPAYGATQTTSTGASARYHSGQVRLDWRPTTSGFSFNASYTFGRSMDDVSAGGGLTDFEFSGRGSPQDPYDVHADWGLSAYDVRHAAIFRGTYLLPTVDSQSPFSRALLNGWQLTGIVQLATGSPLTPIITTGNYPRNLGATGNVVRPDLREGANSNPVLGGPDRYYDVNAFVLQPRGFFGNLGRNTVIGPGIVNTDMGVEKFFDMGGSKKLSLRFEVFNILNRANFSQPSNRAFDASGPLGSAGRITQTSTSARQMQLAMRFTF